MENGKLRLISNNDTGNLKAWAGRERGVRVVKHATPTPACPALESVILNFEYRAV